MQIDVTTVPGIRSKLIRWSLDLESSMHIVKASQLSRHVRLCCPLLVIDNLRQYCGQKCQDMLQIQLQRWTCLKPNDTFCLGFLRNDPCRLICMIHLVVAGSDPVVDLPWFPRTEWLPEPSPK